MKILKTILLICANLFVFILFGQQKGYSGKEFYVMFLNNVTAPETDTSMHVLLISKTNNVATFFNGNVKLGNSYFLKANVPLRVRIKKDNWLIGLPIANPTNAAIKILSKSDMQVFAVNPSSSSSAISAILPVEYLEFGQDYIIHSALTKDNRPMEIGIIALDGGITNVRVYGKKSFEGHFTTSNHTFKQGEGFMLRSAVSNENYAGTRIEVRNSCKRIAVFTSMRCTDNGVGINCNSCDVAFEQQLPTKYFAKEFILPTVPLNNGYAASVVAKFNSTKVYENGILLTTLNANESYTWQKNSVLNNVFIESDKPISVSQMTLSGGCSGHPQGFGDPALLNIPTCTVGVNEALIAPYLDAFVQHYIKVVVKSTTLPKCFVNGLNFLPVNGYETNVFNGKTYYSGFIQVPGLEAYKLSCDSSFQAYYYAVASNVGMATCFAGAFVNSELDFDYSPKKICTAANNINFVAKGDSINGLQWVFPTNTFSTPNVSYKFNKAGTYNVFLIRKVSGGFCSADTIVKEIVINEKPSKLLEPDSNPCNGTNVKINLPNSLKYSYKWEDGGTSENRSILISKKVILIITDTNGCETIDSQQFNFKDCDFNVLKLANVFTPNADGLNDKWKVIMEGYTKAEVVILNRWNQKMYAYTLPNDEHWNGSVGNKSFVKCPDGTYFYYIILYDKQNQTTKKVNGVIHLLRND